MTSLYLPSGSKIGVGYQAHGLANALTDVGHEVTMFSPCPATPGARYAHVHHPTPGPNQAWHWARAIAAFDLSGFDILHAHGEDYLLGRVSRPAHIRTMHGSCFAEALHIQGARERLRMAALGASELVASVRADHTVGVSENTRRWYPWIKTVIPNGVDLDRFDTGVERETVPTVLFVGTYHRRKRGALLMEQFERVVRPAIADARLWMVCEDAPPAPGIESLGRLTDEQLADRYGRAWVFCLPSTYEGFGIPYIEAMASGTPVVATANAGAVEVLDAGRYGRVVPDDQIGTALVQLLRDAPARDRLAQTGHDRSAIYAFPSIAERYVAVYRSELARKDTRGAVA